LVPDFLLRNMCMGLILFASLRLDMMIGPFDMRCRSALRRFETLSLVGALATLVSGGVTYNMQQSGEGDPFWWDRFTISVNAGIMGYVLAMMLYSTFALPLELTIAAQGTMSRLALWMHHGARRVYGIYPVHFVIDHPRPWHQAIDVSSLTNWEIKILLESFKFFYRCCLEKSPFFHEWHIRTCLNEVVSHALHARVAGQEGQYWTNGTHEHSLSWFWYYPRVALPAIDLIVRNAVGRGSHGASVTLEELDVAFLHISRDILSDHPEVVASKHISRMCVHKQRRSETPAAMEFDSLRSQTTVVFDVDERAVQMPDIYTMLPRILRMFLADLQLRMRGLQEELRDISQGSSVKTTCTDSKANSFQ